MHYWPAGAATGLHLTLILNLSLGKSLYEVKEEVEPETTSPKQNRDTALKLGIAYVAFVMLPAGVSVSVSRYSIVPKEH